MEDNKIALYGYFKSNSTQRGGRKRMIEIWIEFARFKTTNERLADKIRTIIKKGWFSVVELLELHQQIYWETYQQAHNTVTETLNSETQKLRSKNKRKVIVTETPHKYKHKKKK